MQFTQSAAKYLGRMINKHGLYIQLTIAQFIYNPFPSLRLLRKSMRGGKSDMLTSTGHFSSKLPLMPSPDGSEKPTLKSGAKEGEIFGINHFHSYVLGHPFADHKNHFSCNFTL
jgi:hypothetical protein